MIDDEERAKEESAAREAVVVPAAVPVGAADGIAPPVTEVVQRRGSSLRSNARTISGAVVLAILMRITIVEAFEIEGPSMEPTLLNGDRVVVTKFSYGLYIPFMDDALANWGTPEAGNVVIVKSPADNIDIVKRVIGVPGDRIEIREDVIYRNGAAVPQRSLGECKVDEELDVMPGCEWVEESLGGKTYRTSHSIVSAPFDLDEVTVPPGHVFLMGDHRDRSNDSRFFGMVPVTRIKGRALAIYWSNYGGVRWDRIFSAIH